MNSLAIDSMANVVVAACLILMFIETKTHFTVAREEEGCFFLENMLRDHELIG